MENSKLLDKHGAIRYYLNNKLHRKNKPAVEYINGYKEWYLNGKLHRKDGPAIEYANDYKEWWLNGEKVNKYDLFKYKIKQILKKLKK